MSDLADLIARLEKATEDSRELDAAIARFVGEAANYEGDGVYGCRAYSSSLDAALSLVPEGWFARIEPRFYDDPDRVVWWANMIHPNWPRYQAVAHGLEEFDAVGIVRHDNMVIALCIAALKARQVKP